MKNRILKFFRSPKLALALLLLLAVLAIPGTILSPEETEKFALEMLGDRLMPAARAVGLVDTYRSPLYLSLAGLLCLNIVVCTWHRFSRRRASSSFSGTRKRTAWLDLVLHLSILVILAGGVGKGLWGFVGTQHLFVGVETDTVFDWEKNADVPLGFTILMKERVKDYYPFRLRVGVKDAASGDKIALLELREGRAVELPGEGELRLKVENFDAETGDLRLLAEGEGRKDVFDLSVQDKERKTASFGPYTLTLVAFQHVLKKVRGRLAVIDDGVEVKEEWLAVNSRLEYMGTSIFQTAWGTDRYGNPYIGVQVARDPAAPLFWVGCVLFSLAMPLFLFTRHRGRTQGG